jgi:hypothetical protein
MRPSSFFVAVDYTMSKFTGTGNIRQTFTQNSNLNTYGLNVMQILQSPSANSATFYKILGSGPQNNRIYSFYKRNGLSTNGQFF